MKQPICRDVTDNLIRDFLHQLPINKTEKYGASKVLHSFFIKFNPNRFEEVRNSYMFLSVGDYPYGFIPEKDEVGSIGNTRCIIDPTVEEYEFYVELKK